MNSGLVKRFALAAVAALVVFLSHDASTAGLMSMSAPRPVPAVEEAPTEATSACNDGNTADDIYVRDGGTGNGSAWDNALDAMAATITRGKDVYIADGTYVGYTFDDAVSGTTVTNVCKATVAQHGTSTGWVDTYGDGQAAFTSGLTFTTGYWTLDGVTGGGPDDWFGTYGFKVTHTNPNTAVIAVSGHTSPTNFIFRHIHLLGMNSVGTDGGGDGNDGFSFKDLTDHAHGPSNVTASYIRFQGIGRCPIFMPRASGTFLFEYSVVEEYFAGVVHGEILSSGGDDATPSSFTFRWSLIRWITSTGGFMWDNHDNHAHTMEIYGNVFYHAAGEAWDNQNGLIGGWTGASLEDFYGARAYNNTFIDTEAGSSALGELPTDFGDNLAKNNLFYSVGDVGGGSWTTISHNHFISTTSTGTNTSTSVGNPFVDMTNLNFRLTGNTTAGTDLGSSYNTDMYGNTRTTWTRGAIEFQ